MNTVICSIDTAFELLDGWRVDTATTRTFLFFVRAVSIASKLSDDNEESFSRACGWSERAVALHRRRGTHLCPSSRGEGMSMAYVLTIYGQCMAEARKK